MLSRDAKLYKIYLIKRIKNIKIVDSSKGLRADSVLLAINQDMLNFILQMFRFSVLEKKSNQFKRCIICY